MEPIQFLLHLDEHIANLINLFGPFTYLILFLIIFAETGLVVTPFLPGDSLLFIVGTLAGANYLNIWIIYPALLSASILGDSTNYWIGRKLGPKVFSKEKSRIFNKAYLEKTREFYDKHGRKTIILARFLPIIRTFAPFVAGIGKMHYPTFLTFSIIGSFTWITSILFAGYFFGGLIFVKKNFEYAVIIIVLLSLSPILIEYIKHKKNKVKKPETKLTTYKEVQQTLKKEHLND
jgi:membrane-associated protein